MQGPIDEIPGDPAHHSWPVPAPRSGPRVLACGPAVAATYLLGCMAHFLWRWHLMDAMTRRWLARASFAMMLAGAVLLLAVAGWRSLTLVGLAAIGVCAVLAGAYWFLANRGVLRWIALVLVV